MDGALEFAPSKTALLDVLLEGRDMRSVVNEFADLPDECCANRLLDTTLWNSTEL